ncbi:IS66 family insertion sequence element accessory protein TnpB [Mesorhizobium carmichaelinearum]|uniref:IS66 family insertion sequence element accessory protein TnpB n=1 Tax=Mesorhizobium carmichaelinearum TaxID=1208188 RepID=UPI001FCEB24E|nr:IS66 family insertion sequence element accessory protein TnpB [Mesorhizobium carmichaelinearum]
MVVLASAAGSSVTEVAQAFGVASQLYAWRKQMVGGEPDADQAMATFARIDVSDLPEVERPVADCPDPAGKNRRGLSERRAIEDRRIVDPTALRIVLAELTR